MIFGLILLLAVVGLALWPALAERRRAPLTAPGPRVVEEGPETGPLALCLPGMDAPLEIFDSLAPKLAARGLRVMRADLPGRGGSAPAAMDTETLVRWLEGVLAGRRDPVLLIGHGMGGALATAYAARHPEAVSWLVLLAAEGLGDTLSPDLPGAGRRGRVADWRMKMLWPRRWRAGLAGRDLPEEVQAQMAAQLDRRGFVPAVRASLLGLLRDPQAHEHRRIAKSGVPVLAIWGAGDTRVGRDAPGRLSQWNRAARQVEIEGAGHDLPATHADRIAEILRDEARSAA